MIKGFYTALVTPFNSDKKLNEEMLRQLIRFQIAGGADGIVVLGTTGEAPTLHPEEKEAIIKIAREETLGKIKLMVGTGNYSTERTIAETVKAQQLGADSALIVTPYYNRPTQEGIYQHFREVARAVDMPIMIYNIQSRTGQNITTDTLMKLSEFNQYCSVKEASGNISQMMDVIHKLSPRRNDFTLLSGDDLLTYPCMALGGQGIVSVIGNLFPLAVRELVTAVQQNDYAKAARMHYRLLPFVHAAFCETNPMPIKAAMRIAGLDVGECRLPLCELTEENSQKLSRLLAEKEMMELIHANTTHFPIPAGTF